MSQDTVRFLVLAAIAAAFPRDASAFRAEAAHSAAPAAAAAALIGIDSGGAFLMSDGAPGMAAAAPAFTGAPARGASSGGSSGGGSAFLPDAMLQDAAAEPVKSGSKTKGTGSNGDDVGPARDLRSKRKAWYQKRRSNPSLNERVKAYRNGSPYRITVFAVGDGEYAAQKAAWAFFQLRRKARRDGVGIEYLSGFRTYAEQAYLYRKYGSPRAAPPGYSNHQQGLSMDIEGVDGYGTRSYQWLKRNAPKFGIRNDVSGEYWHWTYVR